MVNQEIIVRNFADIDFDQLPWEYGAPGPGDPPGEGSVLLCEEPRTGATTHLGKFPAGWIGKSTEWHSAAQAIYLIDGDLNHAGTELRAPAYIYIPARTVHGPFSTVNGCLLFETLDGPFDINYCDE